LSDPRRTRIRGGMRRTRTRALVTRFLLLHTCGVTALPRQQVGTVTEQVDPTLCAVGQAVLVGGAKACARTVDDMASKEAAKKAWFDRTGGGGRVIEHTTTGVATGLAQGNILEGSLATLTDVTADILHKAGKKTFDMLNGNRPILMQNEDLNGEPGLLMYPSYDYYLKRVHGISAEKWVRLTAVRQAELVAELMRYKNMKEFEMSRIALTEMSPGQTFDPAAHKAAQHAKCNDAAKQELAKLQAEAAKLNQKILKKSMECDVKKVELDIALSSRGTQWYDIQTRDD